MVRSQLKLLIEHRIVYGVISNLNRSWERKPLPEFTQST
jgi:hypothetical protein